MASELTAIVGESRRRDGDVRESAERALAALRDNSPNKGGTHVLESGSSGLDLGETAQEGVVDALCAALASHNHKVISPALRALTLLPSSLPAAKIDPLIRALHTATNTPEAHVKILQVLPGFFQRHQRAIWGDTLSTLLSVCSTLQGAHRQQAVAHTAQATFTQLLDAAFEKVRVEDTELGVGGNVLSDEAPQKDSQGSDSVLAPVQVPVDGKAMHSVGPAAHDAYRITLDLCTLIEHHKPAFLQTNYLAEDYGFEILETLIKNNGALFGSHVELGFLLRTRVTPILLRFLSSSRDFSLMVRVARIILLLLSDTLAALTQESEVTLALLTHTLAKNSGAPNWKRVLVLELYAQLLKTPSMGKTLYVEYDYNHEDDAKEILGGLLEACVVILEDNRGVLNTGEVVQREQRLGQAPGGAGALQGQNSSGQSTNQAGSATQGSHGASAAPGPLPCLSAATSAITLPYLSAIDKADPPITPPTYHLLLIHSIACSYVAGIAHELSAPESASLLTNIHPRLLAILGTYLHSTLDTTLFTATLDALESLAISAGSLGLSIEAKATIALLADGALRIQGKQSHQLKVYSLSESIVGTLSSTFGQAVGAVGAVGATATGQTPSKPPKLYPRSISRRNILCFNSVLSTAVAIGERLKEDWDIVALVLQWISYYLDGLSGSNYKDTPPFSPYLDNSDLQLVQVILDDFNAGLQNATITTVVQFENALIKLSNELLNPPSENFGQDPLANGDLQPCIFNKLYPLNKLADLAAVDPVNFFISCEESRALVSDYYGSLIQDRTMDDDYRLLACRNINSLICSCASTGFNYKSDDLNLKTEICVLSALNGIFASLSSLPHTNELLVINCEVKMYLQTFDSLKSIIDRFGILIKQNWDIITTMLNFPFSFITEYDSSILNETTVTEIIVLILKSAFESLKVILDEVLQTIPQDQIKVIIGTLKNFVSQKFDLNISFNSVSYLWIVNDYIKDIIDSCDTKQQLSAPVHTEEDLAAIVSSIDDSSPLSKYSYYCYLWLYLVSSFVSTTFDSRAQVRDAAIITFCDIVETFPVENTSWELIYDIILKPNILELPMETTVDLSNSKELMESSKILASNITKLFINKVGQENSERTTEYWSGLIQYYLKLLMLPYRWVELENVVVKEYCKVITLFQTKGAKNVQLVALFEFWDKLEIVYNIENQRQYHDLLISIVQCIEPSLVLFKEIMTLKRFSTLQNVLLECISYPVLETGKDNFKCSKLQQTVLDNFKLIQNTPLFSGFKETQIEALNKMIMLPFSAYEKPQTAKVPTFIATSFDAMSLLKVAFNKDTKFDTFLNGGSLQGMFEALLVVSKHKNDLFEYEPEKFLWMESLKVLVSVTALLSDYLIGLPPDDVSKLDKSNLDTMIDLILRTLHCCFSAFDCSNEEISVEAFELSEYLKIKRSILQLFNRFENNNKVYNIKKEYIEGYISSIWRMSFLYQKDELLSSILPKAETITGKDMQSLIELVTDDEMCDNYGTTTTLGMNDKLKIAKLCLLDLSELVDPTSYPNLWELGLPFLLSRYALALRKYVSDVQILGKRPTPKVQDVELDHIVKGLNGLLTNLKAYPDYISQVKVLYPMLIFCLTIGRRLNDVELGNVCRQLGSQ